VQRPSRGLADLFKAKCINACPIEQDVPGYLSLVGEGRYEEAISLIYQTNPMPGICGRVCTHPCTDVCVREETDEALAIPQIKRFAADMARERGFIISVKKAQPKGQKVAIVGGGPAGLAAAYHLALMGYEPTVFEELPELGGMLRYGIPVYRLPRDILDQEIDFILSVGVEAKTNTRVGREVTLQNLQENYDAIFIGVGAHRSLPIRIPGEDLPGVRGGAEFLREVELGAAPEVGQKVAVIGGNLRGVSLFVDGRPVQRQNLYFPQLGHLDLNSVLLSNTSEVQLVPGGVAALWGKNLGILGANIVTKDFHAPEPYSRATAIRGPFGFSRTQVELGRKLTSRARFYLTTELKKAREYYGANAEFRVLRNRKQ